MPHPDPTAPVRRRPRWRFLAGAAGLALAFTGVVATPGPPPAAAEPAEPAAARSTEVFPGNDGRPHEVTFDEKSFLVDGERLNVWSGEFHYWRLPSPDHWRDLLQKIRANGFNAVSLYFFWGLHQSTSGGEFDFSGVKDIDRLLEMAAEEGLYVIARPGPYVNAEISMGGLPAYLANRGPGLRTADPENLADSLAWLDAFDRIVLEHEVTTGKGSVIMYQIENEMLSESEERVRFMRALTEKVRGDGISVPLFHNDYNLGGRFVPGEDGPAGDVGLDFYAYDSYPLGFNCSAGRNRIADTEATYRTLSPDFPQFISEAQGGAFSPWGASFGFDRCAEYVDPDFTRQWGANNIGNGVTAFNYYMAFGGTNWGWTGSPSSGYTSYDYGAAIDENRQLTPKLAVQKEIGYFQATVPQLASMRPLPSPEVTELEGAPVNGYERVATEDLETSATGNGTRYLGFRLNDSNSTTETRFTTSLTLGEEAEPQTAERVNDADPAVTYTGTGWEHASGQGWTAGDHGGDESFSDVAGDAVELTFTGTGVKVIAPRANNHGIGRVLIDGEEVGRTSTCLAAGGYVNEHQAVAFETDGLDPRTEHTIRIEVTGEVGCPDGNVEPGAFVAVDAFETTPPLYTVDDSQRSAEAGDGLVTYHSTDPADPWETASGQAWTQGNYLGTETFSDNPGDSVEYTFTGTGIQVIAPQSANHGVARVLIDGEEAGTFTTYSPPQNAAKQHVAFETRGLPDGEHTIRVEVTGEVGSETSPDPGAFVSIDAFNVLTAADDAAEAEPTGPTFDRVPQQEGTYLTLHGRDALMLAADLRVGEHELYYSTSQPVKDMPVEGARLLTVTGAAGDAGETVLHYASEPRVETLDGEAPATVWDGGTGTLRLNYTHGAATFRVSGGGTEEPLLLKLTTREDMAGLWSVAGAHGGATDGAPEGPNAEVLVTGAHLLRTVALDGATAHLTGSMTQAGEIAVHLPPGVTAVTWNGEPLADVAAGPAGEVTGTVPGPAEVATPELTWRTAAESPEADPAFDDSAWTVAGSTSAANPRQGPGPVQGVVLDSNHYRFYEGDVWYRAHYTATDAATISLTGNGGTGGPGHGRNSANMLVWVNGHYAGAAPAEGRAKTFEIPAGATAPGEDVVVSVLVRNQGQNLDWSDDGLSKQNRGLHDADLGATGEVTWRIQGARDVDTPLDTARTLYNNGGLYGERAGWYLPGYPSEGWADAADLHAPGPGVHWYRTSFDLDVPAGQDTAFALDVASERFDAGRSDRARTVMFVNGWNVGTWVGNVGPQTRFTIPSGFLDMDGTNEIAIAVTAEEADHGPDAVSLVQVGSMTGSVPAEQNEAPAFGEVGVTASTDLTQARRGETVTLDGAVELPALAGGTLVKTTVDWGDGTEPATLPGTALTAAHRWTAAGTYAVTVVVRDVVGGAELARTEVSVEVSHAVLPPGRGGTAPGQEGRA
ncbi:beta-galactosidase [Georgenia sp. EYE_87]|uniref:beta-galactosidase n=1 Tax=Georgenia sp. EYE_87 TaxID=2853448 RepID=UPI002003E4D6|nr:beta-galactosidase [Georgenia sp. EYE_87]MCK6210160.1 beta-galactosidase [Georgenia sp. EYE_87]